MLTIERHINHVEAMLALSETNKRIIGAVRFSPDEVESITKLVKVAKTLNTLFDLMDRLIPTDEEKEIK